MHTSALDHDLAARVYAELAHRPSDSAVVFTYAAFERDTMEQWRNIVNSGLRVEFHDGAHHYASSAAMFADLAQGHLWTYLTDPADSQIGEDHPMLGVVARYMGRDLYLNDVFRAVHDVNGHGRSGGSFALSGEFEAWKTHRAMYSRGALAALWCETRGQSAWTNRWADHASLPLAQRPFAVQKAGLPPVKMV